MNLGISNIAWNKTIDNKALALMQEQKVQYLEIAPTKLWSDIYATTSERAREYIQKCHFYNVIPYAFQSIFFNQNHLNIFLNPQQTYDYLKRILQLAKDLHIKRIVFGSPKNRLVPSGMVKEEAIEKAVIFFKKIGDLLKNTDIVFCIEPNPQVYGCNFLTNTSEAASLIKVIDCDNIKLHLDSAIMTLNNEDIENTIKANQKNLFHFHISAPDLGYINDSRIHHALFAHVLRQINYTGVCSIEMKESTATNLDKVKSALLFSKKIYGS